ncbi:3072_t:CDS:1, partial [Racocetra persica]
ASSLSINYLNQEKPGSFKAKSETASELISNDDSISDISSTSSE